MLNFVLQDTVLDGMSSEADYWHFQTWRQNQDVTVVLSGLTEQTEYSYIYCFAEDDEPDGLSPSYPSYPSCLEIRISMDFCELLVLQTLHLCDRSCRYVAPEFQFDFVNHFTSRYDLT